MPDADAAPATVRIIARVVVRRQIDPRRLGWIDQRRAAARRGLPENGQYVDLRGFQHCDLVAVLEEERAGYAALAAAGYSQPAIDQLDARQRQAAIVRIVDFGMAAAVVALSALGCVPVSSCRGNSLGARRHEHPAPMVTFYARRIHLAALADAVARADIGIVNNAAKLEAYADDLRKMHAFAEALLPHIKA
jgi:hypothetical protein